MKVTKPQILETARELFLADGLQGLSMRKLAKSLGVTPASLYWHYANKEALLADVFVDGVEVFSRYLLSALDGETPLERLRLTGDAFMRFGMERPRHFEVFFLHRPEGVDGDALARFATRRRATFQFLVDRVRENLEVGTLRPVGSANELSLVLLSAAQGLVGLHLSGQLRIPPEQFEATYRRSFALLLESFA